MTDNLQPPQGSQQPEFTYETMRQWGREWPHKVAACEDIEQITATFAAYKPWLDKGDEQGSAFRGITPVNFMQSVADWMEQHEQPFVPENPVVISFRELVTSDEIKAEDRAREKIRVAAFSTVPYISERHLRRVGGKLTATQERRVVLNKFCEALEVHPSDTMSRQRKFLHELTDRWALDFDADGEGLEGFDKDLDRLPKTIPLRSLPGLQTRATNLVTDSLLLVAMNGGRNAEKLWQAIDGNKAASKEGSIAKTVSAVSILGLAKSMTDSINQSGGVEVDDGVDEAQTYQLDALPPKDMRYLPEAFRRLLYACIDMDASIEDKDRLAVDLDIATRVEVLEKYAEKTSGAPAPQTQAMGSAALKSATNEQPPRKETGKQIFRPQLFKAGHGKIS